MSLFQGDWYVIMVTFFCYIFNLYKTIDFQVQTDFQQISESQFLTTILDADNINHIVIFLTGIAPLPEGTAGLGKYYKIFKK